MSSLTDSVRIASDLASDQIMISIVKPDDADQTMTRQTLGDNTGQPLALNSWQDLGWWWERGELQSRYNTRWWCFSRLLVVTHDLLTANTANDSQIVSTKSTNACHI